MNYSKHYALLMAKAKLRLLDGYVEKHHIVPKCLGGLDDLENLVALTPEEHYVAHQLLVKIYPDNKKLAYAAYMMTKGTSKHSRSNKLFGWIKRRNFEALKGAIRKPRAKETKPRKPRKLSAEHRRKIGLARIGFHHTQETKDRIRASNIKTKRKL